jgi:RNA polymerase sigma-70 factor (ECF subfamily)
MNDESLRQACEGAKTGDRDAFEGIYRTTVDEVFRYVYARVRNRDDTYDVVQNVYVELWDSMPSFTYQARGGFYRYLYTITKRQVIGHYNSRPSTTSLEDVPEQADESPHPEDLERTTLLHTLGLMREPDRTIIELRYWGGLPFRDIADRIGMSTTATKVRHFRALRALHKAFNHHEEKN